MTVRFINEKETREIVGVEKIKFLNVGKPAYELELGMGGILFIRDAYKQVEIVE